MIVYSKRLGGLPLLFRITGTAWPAGILPALVSVAMCFALGYDPEVDDLVTDKSKFMQHPYPFQLYAFIIGFLIVFRTNFAYQRYWEGRSTLAQMASKWLDGACMSVTFDAPGSVDTPLLEGIGDSSTAFTSKNLTKNGAQSHESFVAEILHLFSLMHALALQHLRGDANLDNLIGFSMLKNGHTMTTNKSLLAGNSYRSILANLPEAPIHSDKIPQLARITSRSMIDTKFDDVYKEQRFAIIGDLRPEERRALDADGHGNSIPTEARVTMVEGWIFRRLIARQKHESCDMGITSPPILSRLYQVISDGCLGFGQAAKIADTPFPFPYQNLLQLFLWVYVFTVPFVMNAWLKEPVLRAVLTFLSVWCYFALNQVGNNLEDPYIPYDPNEIPLMHIQHSFNAKLLSYGVVPEPELEYSDELYKSASDNIDRLTSFESPIGSAGQTPLAPTSSERPASVPATKAAAPSKDVDPSFRLPDGAGRGAGLVAEAKLGSAPPTSSSVDNVGRIDEGPMVTRISTGGAGFGGSAPSGTRDERKEEGGIHEITPLVAGSLRELAAVHAKCLHIVGSLEGALARLPFSGQGAAVESAGHGSVQAVREVNVNMGLVMV
mmetsp:Transcript_525/g.1408  ORF Transcript_525/g.1408 Transcript_525/m.1408 type:complete len:608 (+) Transcript_525:132-1955(+)